GVDPGGRRAMGNVITLGRSSELALYLSPDRVTTTRLRDLIVNERHPCKGVLVDAALWRRQVELVEVANDAGIETILASPSLELSRDEGRERPGISTLPWAGSVPHTPALLAQRDARQELAGRLAEFVVQQRVSAVLVPTHFLRTAGDPWGDVDEQ